MENIRKKLFWAIDSRRGNKIRDEYCDIVEAFNNPNFDDSKALKDILNYAIGHVPAYSNVKSERLEDFPVVSKINYKDNQRQYISDEYQNTETLYRAATSGSTGTPTEIFQDDFKRIRHSATLIAINEMIGWELGDHFVFLRNWVDNYFQSFISSLRKNEKNFCVSRLDEREKQKLYRHLKRNKGSNILGYSSSLVDFNNYLKRRSISRKDLGVKLIVCDSDELTDANKKELEEGFDCPVINRYDNEENGLLAFTLPGEDAFLVNYPNIHVELLETDSDNPVIPGDVGRVVITDLYNHAMPLIRYDTGDLARSDDPSDRIHTLSSLSGRSSDYVLSTDKRRIYTPSISVVPEVFFGIDRYQLIQNSEKDYQFIFTGSLSPDEKDKIIERFKDCLGQDANIIIDKRDVINVQANGKHKTLIRMENAIPQKIELSEAKSNIRSKAYWTKDFINKSPVRTKYNILKQSVIDGLYSNENELKNILEHAIKTVPYYENIKDDDITSFPIIRKEIIKNSYEDFRSKEYLDESKLIELHTSGSSGTPFKAYQDKEKDVWHKAALIFQNEQIGWNVGDRWAHMRNWGLGKDPSRFEILKKNIVPLSVLNLEEEKLENCVKTLETDKKIHLLLGYSSALERLAWYIIDKGYQDKDFGIKLIIGDSDNLKDETWDLLEKIFKCPVLNRYGSIENGIIALTKPYDRTFYIDTSQFYVEILKMDEDISVKEGEIGRVVITDLHNKALPFIRYYNGDLARAKKIIDGQCVEIDSLQGREISALQRTDGIILSETNIMGHFKKFTDIRRYQIIQIAEKEYLMKVECDNANIDERCTNELKDIFGEDAIITIEHVDVIECEKNGKYRVTKKEI